MALCVSAVSSDHLGAHQMGAMSVSAHASFGGGLGTWGGGGGGERGMHGGGPLAGGAASLLLHSPERDDGSGTILCAPLDDSPDSPTLGFGIAISGGVDNPLYTSGEPAVVISDVVANGPAWGLLQLSDRILSANGISFESIEYGRAVDVIKHSEQINMIVKRRVAMPVMEFEQRTLKFTLTKSRKKDDFGIVLGCKFYIKEIRNPKLAEKDPGLREGDSVLRINGQSLEGTTLDEASKWLERSREKLCLVIQRDVRRGASRWPSTQTVYERLGSVAATPRHSPSPLMHQPVSARSSHEYINSPSWRQSIDKGMPGGGNESIDGRIPAPSSPLMAASPHPHHEYQYYSSQTAKLGDERGVRQVCFDKVGGSVGIRVVGGNEVGIFVSAVASDSPAAHHGVSPGDRILDVNGRSMRGVTREAAVQLLLALEDRVLLRLENAAAQFEHVRTSQIGDNFYIRAHFTKDKKGSPLELTLSEGDIFHVTDTLFGGTVGLWQAQRVYSASGRGDGSKGVIPNLTSAESFAREARRIAEQRGGKGTLLRRKLESRRTKSLPKNMLGEEMGGAGMVLPAYERVALNTPSFHRPLVLYGPLADVARRELLSQFALRFAEPESEGVVRLAAVDSIIAAGKHAILDVTVDSVERLQLAQYAPIVILIDVEGRSRIREIRKRLEAPRKSSRMLAEQAGQIKKHHAHLLSATVDATQEEGWFSALRELIAHLQQRRLWMPELPSALPLEDVLLFTNKDTEKEFDTERDRSLHADYVEYTQRSTNDLTRSIYDWDSSSEAARAGGAGGGPNKWSTMPRKVIVGGNQQQPQQPQRQPAHLGSSGALGPQRVVIGQPSAIDAYQRRPNSNPPLDGMPASQHYPWKGGQQQQRVPSPRGYYHVQQLLNDPEESALVSELASNRLDDRDRRIEDGRSEMRGQEERRIEELRSRVEEQQRRLEDATRNYDHPPIESLTRAKELNGHGGGPSSSTGSSPPAIAPSSSSGISSAEVSTGGGPSPGEKPTIAPKPNLYGDASMRNKWTDSSPTATTNGNGFGTRDDKTSPPSERSEGGGGRRSAPRSSAPAPAPVAPTSSTEEEPVVVEQATAWLGPEGGLLTCPVSNVHLIVPPGAIAQGQRHEVYVKVCEEGGSDSPADAARGEQLLSPLVMCGPHGLEFLVPVELRLPHSVKERTGEDWKFSLKTGDGEEWKHVDVQPDAKKPFISLPISKF